MGIDDLKSRVSKAKDRITEFGRESSVAVLGMALSDLDLARPLLARAGFELLDVVVAVTAPPSVTVSLQPAGENRLAEVLDEPGIGIKQKALLKAMHELFLFDPVLDEKGYEISKVSVTMGAPPKVRASLRKREEED